LLIRVSAGSKLTRADASANGDKSTAMRTKLADKLTSVSFDGQTAPLKWNVGLTAR
jgi:hypothetical protein